MDHRRRRWDLLKLLEENCLRIVRQLINNIHETGERSKDFPEVSIALNKQRATKCGNHRTISLIAHISQIVARILEGLKGKLKIYEGWNFNSGNYLFTTDTK